MKKAEVCYFIRQVGHDFITEAQTCKPPHRIVDVVDIDTGEEIEIFDKCLTDITKQAIKEGADVTVVKPKDSYRPRED